MSMDTPPPPPPPPPPRDEPVADPVDRPIVEDVTAPGDAAGPPEAPSDAGKRAAPLSTVPETAPGQGTDTAEILTAEVSIQDTARASDPVDRPIVEDVTAPGDAAGPPEAPSDAGERTAPLATVPETAPGPGADAALTADASIYDTAPDTGESPPGQDASHAEPDGPLTPMGKFEASADRSMAEDIIAHRNQQDILRQQGNEQDVLEVEDFINKLPTTDAVKADPQGYLDGLGNDQLPPSAPDTQSEAGGEPASVEAAPPGGGGPPRDDPHDDRPPQDSDDLATDRVTDAPGAGDQAESSRWLMQLHVEGPRGPIDDRPRYSDPDGIRTDRYWMPVDDLVTNDQRVANGNWAQLCGGLGIPPNDPIASLYAPEQMVKEWDLVAAQHGLAPEWGARTQVTFARVPDKVAYSAKPVDPVHYAPWSAEGRIVSFPQVLRTDSGSGEQPDGNREAVFSYKGIPMPMGKEVVRFRERLDTPESVDAPQSTGLPFDEAWIHGPPHEALELADRVIAVADAAAGGDPLGRSIEIARAMSDQTFQIDHEQDSPVVARDNARNLQERDQRYREGGKLLNYGEDRRIRGTGSTDENEVTGERVALGGGKPRTTDRFVFKDHTGAVSPASVPEWVPMDMGEKSSDARGEVSGDVEDPDLTHGAASPEAVAGDLAADYESSVVWAGVQAGREVPETGQAHAFVGDSAQPNNADSPPDTTEGLVEPVGPGTEYRASGQGIPSDEYDARDAALPPPDASPPSVRPGSADILRAQTEGQQVTPVLREIAADTGGTMLGLEHNIKSQESLERKVAQSDKEPTDVLRYTMAFPHNQIVDGAKAAMASLKANDYQIDELKNGWLSPVPGDYRGINTTVESPRGYRFELQFHTPESFAVKEEGTHDLYEVDRDEDQSLTDRDEAEFAARLYSATLLVPPPGIEQISPFTRRKENN